MVQKILWRKDVLDQWIGDIDSICSACVMADKTKMNGTVKTLNSKYWGKRENNARWSKQLVHSFNDCTNIYCTKSICISLVFERYMIVSLRLFGFQNFMIIIRSISCKEIFRNDFILNFFQYLTSIVFVCSCGREFFSIIIFCCTLT